MSELIQARLRQGKSFRVDWITAKAVRGQEIDGWVVDLPYPHYVMTEYKHKGEQKVKVVWRAS